MKIGFNMLLWTTAVDDSHLPILERLKAAGYDGVEIPVFAGDPAAYAALGRRLDDIGLRRSAITVIPSPDLDPIADDPAVRDRARSYLAWAIDCTAALGADVLCGPLHQALGRFSGLPRSAAETARAIAAHRAVGDHAAASGVVVALEALNRFECYFLTTMADLAAHVAAVDHPAIRGMYDSFHANVEEKDPVAALAAALPHVAHVHVSENDRGTPGSGHVPFAETFAVLKRGGYDGWLTIESFSRALPELAAATRVWRDFSPDPDEPWREGIRFIRAGWAAA